LLSLERGPGFGAELSRQKTVVHHRILQTHLAH
jgi:hypothetical protein